MWPNAAFPAPDRVVRNVEVFARTRLPVSATVLVWRFNWLLNVACVARRVRLPLVMVTASLKVMLPLPRVSPALMSPALMIVLPPALVATDEKGVPVPPIFPLIVVLPVLLKVKLIWTGSGPFD